MVGRFLFSFFGSLILVASWIFATRSLIGTPTQHVLFSMIGIGFMLGAVACGAAEGRRHHAPVVSPQWPIQQPTFMTAHQPQSPSGIARPPYPTTRD
jgi:hypothetical protein